MPTPSSTSTVAELWAIHDDNADYFSSQDVAKAKLYIHALEILTRLPRRGASGARGGEEYEYDTRVLQDKLKEAKEWLVDNDSSFSEAGAIHFDVSEIRR